MKKNMLTIIILALSLINVILTLLIVFVVVPTSMKTNKLITQVASVVDLELATEKKDKEADSINISDIDTRTIEKVLTINLKPSENDDTDHFAMIDSVTLSLNENSKDYDKLIDKIESNHNIITEQVTSTFNKYTLEECISKKEEIRAEILLELQTYFASDFIVNVSFGNLRAQ